MQGAYGFGGRLRPALLPRELRPDVKRRRPAFLGRLAAAVGHCARSFRGGQGGGLRRALLGARRVLH